MANKRICKKKRKQSVIIYDGNSAPDGMTFSQIVNLAKSKGIILYNTSNGGTKPIIYPKENTKYYKFKEVFEWQIIN